LSFASEVIALMGPMPTYAAWLGKQDVTYAYAYYVRTLKMLQWKNPGGTWLLKSVPYFDNLPVLFKMFPDAQVVISHRDPIKAHSSAVPVAGINMWMRSDKPLDSKALELLLVFEAQVARLNKVLDELACREISSSQVHNFQYADLIANPIQAISKLYADLGLDLTQQIRELMAAYVDARPKNRFGNHQHAVLEDTVVVARRALLDRYQRYFRVPNEN
jgi:hypothetical protein